MSTYMARSDPARLSFEQFMRPQSAAQRVERSASSSLITALAPILSQSPGQVRQRRSQSFSLTALMSPASLGCSAAMAPSGTLASLAPSSGRKLKQLSTI